MAGNEPDLLSIGSGGKLSTPATVPNAPAQRAKDDLDVYRVILQEAGNDPEGMRAVASVIRNRSTRGAGLPQDVVYAPGQFGPGSPRDSLEYRGWQKIAGVPANDPRLQAVIKATRGIVSGAEPTPYPYTSYYSPKVQAAAGRHPPSFDDGTGVDIAGNRFFTADSQEPDLTAIGGGAQPAGRPVRIAATPGTPRPGPVSDPQADAIRFMAAHGLLNPNAEPGSSTNPLGVTQGGPQEPAEPGKYYFTRAGELRQSGSDGDFMPYYRDVVSRQAIHQAQPVMNRLFQLSGVTDEPKPTAPGGVVQAGLDTAYSANKLLGGGLAVPSAQPGPVPMTALADLNAEMHGGATPRDFQSAGLTDAQDERNRYELLRGSDPVASAGRFAGQAGISGLAAAAVPEIELPGAAGNALIRAGGGLLTNAGRGVAATAPLVSTSDAPIGNQLVGGAATGMIIPPVFNAGARAMARALESPLTPAVRDLASLATDKYGIPLRVGQIKGAGNPFGRSSVADSKDFSRWGTGYLENHAEQMRAFTRAVANTFGEDAEALTPDVMQRAKDRIGSVFNRVASNTNITDTAPLQTRLGQIVHDAQQVLPDTEASPVLKQIENIGSSLSNGQMSGETYQALTRSGAPLDRLANSSNPNLRHYAGQIRDALDDALESSASQQDLADLGSARWQYKNLMTIRDLAAKAGVDGTISPTLLNGVVNRSFRNRAFAGAGDLGELSQIGQTFLKPPPNSGTEPRLMEEIRHATGGGILPAAAAGLLSHEPSVGLGVYASRLGMGAAGLGRNLLTGAYNRNPVVRNLLINGANVGNALDQMGNVGGRVAVIPGAIEANRLFFAPPAPLQSGQ